MRVKFTVLSLTMLLSSVTFAWGFFGPSAKDIENAVIERWEPTTYYICGNRVKDKLEMKSVKASKTERKDIWKVTYTLIVPYEARKDTGQAPKPRRIYDLLGQAEEEIADTEVRYKRISYISVCSAHKQGGKLVLKFLPVPAELNPPS